MGSKERTKNERCLGKGCAFQCGKPGVDPGFGKGGGGGVAKEILFLGLQAKKGGPKSVCVWGGVRTHPWICPCKPGGTKVCTSHWILTGVCLLHGKY